MSTKSRSAMMGPMRGHMALNSSPYKTSVNKLSSQYLIQDQMASHYYNLATIKSAIDSKPPKSMQQSVKKRDQIRRDAMLHGKKTPQQKSPRQFNQGDINEKTTEMQTRYNQNNMSATYSDIYMDELDRGHRTHTSRSWAPERSMPQTSRSRPATTGHAMNATYRDKNNETKTRPRSAKPNILDVTYSGDYLDKHSNRFHTPDNKPFTPRTKKRPGKSFLSQSKHYCAPPSKNKNRKKKEGDLEKREGDITERNLKDYEVPQLEIERDDDHRRWIEEQSEFVQRLSLMDEEGKLKSTATSSFGGKSDTMRRIEEEEEELKYLEFINEVTNDILSRGIYSDMVLEQVMERHVQRRKHDLKVNKMRKLLLKLKSDLGMNLNEPEPPLTAYEYNSLASEKLRHDVNTLKSLPETSKGVSHKNDNDFDSMSNLSYTQTSKKSARKRSIITKLKGTSKVPEKSEQGREESVIDDVFIESKHTSKPPSELNLNKEQNIEQTIETDALLSPKLDEQELIQKLSDLELKQNQSDESDYESVAALSMVITPESKSKPQQTEHRLKSKNSLSDVTEPKQLYDPTEEDAGTKVSHNDNDDVAYSDDFNEEPGLSDDDEF